MKNRIFPCLLFSLLTVQGAFAAGPDSLLLKYLHYRQLFNSRFILIGEGHGMSQPAQKRSSETQLEWSDATIDLGWYISVLATEYAVLAKNGQGTDSTTRELYYALAAFNRLDDYAEAYFRESLKGSRPVPGKGEAQRNGFFVRDDVTDEFIRQHNDHFRLKNMHATDPADPGFEKGISEGYGPREMSFDQVVHLFMGFSLTAKLVDTSASYKGVNIVNETRAIVKRVTSYLRHGIWKIKNPVTGKLVMGVTFTKKPHGIRLVKADAAGALADFMSYGITVTASKIEKGFSGGSMQAKPYRNMATRLNKPFFRMSKRFNRNILFLHLAATGDSWGKKTQRRLCTAGMNEHREHLPLVHMVIYGAQTCKGKTQVSEACFARIKAMLCTAPWEGPNLEAGDLEWSGNNRFRDFPRSRSIFRDVYFNGLDYMLIYNLYRLTAP